jgi:hypothetical protein
LLSSITTQIDSRVRGSTHRQCEQSCTESRPIVCHCLPAGDWRNQPKARQGESMEPYRPSLRRQFASAWQFAKKLLTLLTPQVQEVRAQRMCPFCGLITARAKQVCLECGKSIGEVSLQRKAAQQV